MVEKQGCIDPKISSEIWELRLYIAGQTLRSKIILANLKKFCEERLAGKYRIEVIDLIKNPQIAKRDNIVTIPLLIRNSPKPVRKLTGDFSNAERVIVGLDLCPTE